MEKITDMRDSQFISFDTELSSLIHKHITNNEIPHFENRDILNKYHHLRNELVNFINQININN